MVAAIKSQIAPIQLSQVLRPASRFKPAAQHISNPSSHPAINPSTSPINPNPNQSICVRRHGCAATSAVTCAECCRATSTMTATQELDDRICSAIPVVALARLTLRPPPAGDFPRLERLSPSKNLAALFSRHSALTCGSA